VGSGGIVELEGHTHSINLKNVVELLLEIKEELRQLRDVCDNKKSSFELCSTELGGFPSSEEEKDFTGETVETHD
jgi:hypothetical protein